MQEPSHPMSVALTKIFLKENEIADVMSETSIPVHWTIEQIKQIKLG